MAASTVHNTQTNTRVTVQATLAVVSTTPIERGRSYILTSLDHAMKPYTLHVIYYYKAESSAAVAATFNDSTFGRLRTSLSELLCLYPTITGRLRREGDDWRVKFTDAGVRTLRAKVATTLDECMRSAGLKEEMDLTVVDEFPDDTEIWSPFRIQVKLLPIQCEGRAVSA